MIETNKLDSFCPYHLLPCKILSLSCIQVLQSKLFQPCSQILDLPERLGMDNKHSSLSAPSVSNE